MTLSIAGRCARTGQFGIAISSSSPAVAARCAWARAGVGAACTQNITDPRLGPALLDLLAAGATAPQAMAAVTGEEPADRLPPTHRRRPQRRAPRPGPASARWGVCHRGGARIAWRPATCWRTAGCPRPWSAPSSPVPVRTWGTGCWRR